MKESLSATNLVLGEVHREREAQDQKWGEQNHAHLYWLGILMEEVGETAKACIEGNQAEYEREMIQVAAVAVAAIESLRRRKKFTGELKD